MQCNDSLFELIREYFKEYDKFSQKGFKEKKAVENFDISAFGGDITILTSDNEDEITHVKGNRVVAENVYDDIKLVFGDDERYNFSVQSSSGDITIKKLIANQLFVKSATGDVNLENCQIDQLAISSGHCDVHLKNVVAKKLLVNVAGKGEVKAKNVLSNDSCIEIDMGEIILNNVAASDLLKTIIYLKGGIDGEDIAAKMVDIRTANGDIKLERTVFDDSIIISSDGDVKLETNKDCPVDDVYTESGDIKVKYFKKKK